MAHCLHIESVDGVARAVLDDGTGANLLGHQFLEEFEEFVHGSARQAKCIVIVARGKNFSLGGDLSSFEGLAETEIAEAARRYHEAELALLALNRPVVLGVQGWTVGFALSLALAADIVVMGEGARLRAAYVAVGLTPDGGMATTLPAVVGRGRALDMLLSNRPMDAEEALHAGLASRLVPDAEVLEAALGLAQELALGPSKAIQATLCLVRPEGKVINRHELEGEARSMGQRAASEEGREGVRAFREGRKPRWTGRVEGQT